MNDSKRLTQMIHNSRRYLSDHNRASLDQLVQGGEAIEWPPIAKRVFVALLILENVHQDNADDLAYISGLYGTLNHECDVELFRQVYLDVPELEAQRINDEG